MMIVLLYILIAIMAFIFGVTISHTITKEASVIGTLRASGYSRMELFRQYITTPVLITLAGAIIGNILGYTVFKYMIVDMYYGSYSLLSYTTHWNADAFVRTTIVPILLMLAITSITLYRKLKLSPLQFIRKDLKKENRPNHCVFLILDLSTGSVSVLFCRMPEAMLPCSLVFYFPVFCFFSDYFCLLF